MSYKQVSESELAQKVNELNGWIEVSEDIKFFAKLTKEQYPANEYPAVTLVIQNTNTEKEMTVNIFLGVNPKNVNDCKKFYANIPPNSVFEGVLAIKKIKGKYKPGKEHKAGIYIKHKKIKASNVLRFIVNVIFGFFCGMGIKGKVQGLSIPFTVVEMEE